MMRLRSDERWAIWSGLRSPEYCAIVPSCAALVGPSPGDMGGRGRLLGSAGCASLASITVRNLPTSHRPPGRPVLKRVPRRTASHPALAPVEGPAEQVVFDQNLDRIPRHFDRQWDAPLRIMWNSVRGHHRIKRGQGPQPPGTAARPLANNAQARRCGHESNLRTREPHRSWRAADIACRHQVGAQNRRLFTRRSAHNASAVTRCTNRLDTHSPKPLCVNPPFRGVMGRVGTQPLASPEVAS
jgi:hypothetical protein